MCEWKGRIEIGPTNPYGLFSLVGRIKSRNSLPRDLYTETEKELLSASERINEAAVNRPHLISRFRPEVTPLNGVVQGDHLSGPAAEALRRVGGGPESQLTSMDFRPVCFESLYTMKASQRSRANFLWVEYYNHVWLLAIKLPGLHWMRAPRRAQLFTYKASLQAPFPVSTTKIFNRNCVRTLLSHLRLTDFGNINATVGKRFSSPIANEQCNFPL